MKKQFFLLTLSSTLRRLAISLIGLFSPVYIFRIVFSVADIGSTIKMGLIAVLVYALIFYLVKILVFPLAENLSFKIGFKNVMLISFLPFFLFLPFIILAENHLYFLILAAIFGGCQASLFWFGYHGMFIKSVNDHCFGFHEGICNGLGIFTLLITPTIGSLLIFFFGFTSLFLAAGFLAFLSAVSIVFSPTVKPYHDACFLKSFLLFKQHPKNFLAYLGWGGETAIYGNLWPIFLILFLGNILAYGGILTAGILLSVLATLSIGKWVDNAKGRRVLNIGVALGAFSWLLRVIAYFPILIVVVDGFYRLTEQMISIPMDVFSYKRAISGGTSQALYFREVALNLGVIVFLSVAIFLIWFNLPFWSVFILGFLGTLAPLLVLKKV